MLAIKEAVSNIVKNTLIQAKQYFVQIKDAVLSVNNELPDINGNVEIKSVESADNLNSQYVHSSDEAFAFRTTGGEASLQDGDGWLMRLRGKHVHNGYSAQSVDMTVTAMERQEGETPITAQIDEDAFIAEMQNASGTFSFLFSTSWNYNPASYGITVTGDPIAGDTISVEYEKEARGTIVQSNPQSFVSTGWNLYNHALGYAKVKKYSNIYGFMAVGTYTALQFSETVDGEKESLSDVDGSFTIPSDGFVWVTGGNATDTAIYMTWSDWTSGANGGVWQGYSQTDVSLSAVMSNYFPNGLCEVGRYQDEINLNIGTCTVWVERLEYNAENLAIAKASGRDYEYDEDYIYLGKDVGLTYDISLDGSFVAFDHGVEYFTGTEANVETQTIYGVNLKNKLERDVLTISAQSLTTAQKAQARTNIGAASAEEIGTVPSGQTVEGQIASLNSNFTPSVVAVQPFGQWTNYTGGYYVIGNMVVVQITAIAGNFGANDYFTMVSSLPTPAAAAALSISTTSDNYKGAEAYVGADGKLIVKSGANALTGQRVVVTGIYIKT